jgi:glutamate-1-semialdehyde 2,1-aminomutase
MSSSRLPGKVMRDVDGVPLIELLLLRLSMSTQIDQIIVATSIETENSSLVDHVHNLGFETYIGSEKDVLDRYYSAALQFHGQTIVRVTGDCPMIDAGLVDDAINEFRAMGVDYLTNSSPPTFPDGLDVEVFKFSSLERAHRESASDFEREHVTPYMRNSNLFTIHNLSSGVDLSNFRWTVDEVEDLEVARFVFRKFGPNRLFSWKEVLGLYEDYLVEMNQNSHIKRNEGASMGSGQKLWTRAKKVIPGGNMLLSKRSEMFLPEKWPAYFSKAKGCEVWDLDGRKYTDVSLMGVGTNSLGYGHDEVDYAVRGVVENGNLSTLNCPEEVYLAEKLVDIHPWAEMVRFTRSGGEANAVAVRIARAASGKSGVAFCGYHGWHDWYLSANLGDETHLAGHLLPGLETNGVPLELSGTSFPFGYNKIDELKDLLKSKPIGVIMMEVSRSFGPEPGYLEEIRKLATENNAVLIFDECTSGFRQTFGGLHSLYGVEPDLAMFGKAIGNGYAINAVIGRREVMEEAQSSFISSTFWTERIGPAAALKTLEVMERIKSWEIITGIGLDIQARWMQIAKKHNVKINISGLPALSTFSIPGTKMGEYKTLITQEMLKRNILAANSVYVCTEHSEAALEDYFSALDDVFVLIEKCENGLDPTSLLDGPVAHNSFLRLN